MSTITMQVRRAGAELRCLTLPAQREGEFQHRSWVVETLIRYRTGGSTSPDQTRTPHSRRGRWLGAGSTGGGGWGSPRGEAEVHPQGRGGRPGAGTACGGTVAADSPAGSIRSTRPRNSRVVHSGLINSR